MDYQQLAPPAPLPAPPVQLPHVHMLQQHHQHIQQMQHLSNGTSVVSSGPQNQNLPVHINEADPRWSQYQQLWRQHHAFVNNNNNTIGAVNGKSSANSTGSSKGDCDSHSGSSAKDKDSDCSEGGGLWGNVEAQAAFLGPNIWDKTLPYDADLKYVDLDEFLSENGIPVDGIGHGGGLGSMGHLGGLGGSHRSEALGHPLGGMPTQLTKRERSPSPSECMSPDTMNPASPADSTFSMASSGRDFDPRTRAFSDEELKPQPMIKKSRKQVQASTSDFVPDDLKDDKYWARRRKNNMAAKRSRDARRMKENQIALRAGYLEKENIGLRQELDRLKKENMMLRDKLSKFTDV